MQVETVSDAFVEFLQNQGIATLDVDIYISQVPDDAPDTTYWITTSGGNTVLKLVTGEKVKQYFISVFYRSTSAREIERKLFNLEELLNCAECVTLTGFEVYEIGATQFPSDQDLDSEDRRVGFLQANIKIYKKEC